MFLYDSRDWHHFPFLFRRALAACLLVSSPCLSTLTSLSSLANQVHQGTNKNIDQIPQGEGTRQLFSGRGGTPARIYEVHPSRHRLLGCAPPKSPLLVQMCESPQSIMIDSDNGSIPLLAIRLCSTTGYITHWLYSPKLLPLIKKRIKVIQMGEDNIMPMGNKKWRWRWKGGCWQEQRRRQPTMALELNLTETVTTNLSHKQHLFSETGQQESQQHYYQQRQLVAHPYQ